MFPAVDALVTLSVVSEVGETKLYIAAYGQLPSPRDHLVWTYDSSQHVEQLYTSRLCGGDYSRVIPGSSPPLCQMQVLVLTSDRTVYDITASLTGQLVELIAGQPMEGAVSADQPTWYYLRVVDELSNITLVVTATDGASSLTLTIGLRDASRGLGGINPLRSFTQQPDSDVLLCELSYTDPMLQPYYQGYLHDELLAVLSTTAADPASFSIVYSAANGTDYTIVQLLDGVPQAGVVDVSIYSFYYFQPPAAGWPYAVTIDVEGDYDTVRAVTSNGPVTRPTQSQQSLVAGRAPKLITQGDTGICDPSINTTCGYSISVQGNRDQGYTEEYTITITTGRWMRDLYRNRPPQPGALLGCGGLGLLANDFDHTVVVYQPEAAVHAVGDERLCDSVRQQSGARAERHHRSADVDGRVVGRRAGVSDTARAEGRAAVDHCYLHVDRRHALSVHAAGGALRGAHTDHAGQFQCRQPACPCAATGGWNLVGEVRDEQRRPAYAGVPHHTGTGDCRRAIAVRAVWRLAA